jgi:mono/diheme cytochrome c family protein
MADHYVIATYARDCVIAGDVEALRAPLQTLADYQYTGVAPGGWVRGIAELQEAARLTAQADSIDTAAAGVATMGRICGACHQSGGKGPTPPPAQLQRSYDEEPDSLQQRMGRHMMGAQQLWDGLTMPSTAAWRAGSYAIGHAPEPADRELPSGFTNALAEVRALGARAANLEHASERADLYGLLLTTCADCHSRVMDHDL